MKPNAKVSSIVGLALSLILCRLTCADEIDLLWSTFLGGSGQESGDGDIALDDSGNIYVSGTTYSSDFPTTAGAFDTSLGSIDAFVAKLNPSASALVYSTLLGGRLASEHGYGIAVDGNGNAYVTGSTWSLDFPTTAGAFDTSFNALSDSILFLDAFVTKLNPTGSDLIFSTFLGGKEGDVGGYGIDVDSSGNVYVAGGSFAFDFPVTAGAFDPTYNGGFDVFITKFNATGSDLEYSTLLGGSGWEYCFGIFVNTAEEVYLSGHTESVNFPTTAGAFDTTHNGHDDAFVAKLNSTGNDLIFATFLGGDGEDWGFGINVDGSGRAHVVGHTTSVNFPTTAGAFDTTHNGHDDAFVAKLNPAGSTLEYSTLLGGSGNDEGWGIALDDSGCVYVNGQTQSADLPTTVEAFDPTFNGKMDAFVAKLSSTGNVLDYATYLGGSSSDWGNAGIALGGSGNIYITGGTSSADFPSTAGVFDTTFNGNWDAFVAKLSLTSTPVQSEVSTDVVPKSFVLLQNHPNPFNNKTEIRYQLPQDGHATLKIYNCLGQEVRTLVEGEQSAGEYRVVWDCHDLGDQEVASGLYLCRLMAGDFGKTIKMVLIK